MYKAEWTRFFILGITDSFVRFGSTSRIHKRRCFEEKQSPSYPKGNTSATYDASGNILSQSDVSGRTTSNVFDGAGQISSVTDGNGTGSLTYNTKGQIAVLPKRPRRNRFVTCRIRLTEVQSRIWAVSPELSLDTPLERFPRLQTCKGDFHVGEFDSGLSVDMKAVPSFQDENSGSKPP